MKHMSSFLEPAPIAALPVPTLSLEAEELSLEGLADAIKHPLKALKKAFPQANEEVFKQEIKIKRLVLLQEKKHAEKLRSTVSQSKEKGTHSISLTRVMKKVNFTAFTPEQVVAGLQKNRKFVKDLIEEVSHASQKAQAEKVHDKLEAEMNKKGVVKDEMMVSKAQALKIIDEQVLMIQTVIDLLNVLDKLQSSHLSSEGLGDFIVKTFVSVVKVVAVFSLLAAIFSLPWWIVIGGVVPAFYSYGLATSSEQEKAHHLLEER